MNVRTGIVSIAVSIIQSIGSILFLFGFISVSDSGIEVLLFAGMALLVLGEAAGIYLTKYEEPRKLRQLGDEFLNKVGTLFAWPVVMLAIYMISPSKASALFTFAFTIIAAIRVTSLIIKVYLIDKIYRT